MNDDPAAHLAMYVGLFVILTAIWIVTSYVKSQREHFHKLHKQSLGKKQEKEPSEEKPQVIQAEKISNNEQKSEKKTEGFWSKVLSSVVAGIIVYAITHSIFGKEAAAGATIFVIVVIMTSDGTLTFDD